VHPQRAPARPPRKREPFSSLSLALAATILADPVGGISADRRAAGQSWRARRGIGQRAGPTGLAVVDRGAGAIVGAEAGAASGAGRGEGAGRGTGIAGPGADQPAVAGGVAAIAATDETVDAGRIVAARAAEPRAASGQGRRGRRETARGKG